MVEKMWVVHCEEKNYFDYYFQYSCSRLGVYGQWSYEMVCMKQVVHVPCRVNEVECIDYFVGKNNHFVVDKGIHVDCQAAVGVQGSWLDLIEMGGSLENVSGAYSYGGELIRGK